MDCKTKIYSDNTLYEEKKPVKNKEKMEKKEERIINVIADAIWSVQLHKSLRVNG